MNGFEHFFCSSSLWSKVTSRHLLPWMLSGSCLGEHVLEIGAGYGAATPFLRERASQVTSLEYDSKSIARLKACHKVGLGGALRGDASQLPFAGQTFTSAVAILVLHHLKSRELQDQMFAEVLRVLRPGGHFFAFEISDSWIHRVGHIASTFTPLVPGSAIARLSNASFSTIELDSRFGGFRLRAVRPHVETQRGQ